MPRRWHVVEKTFVLTILVSLYDTGILLIIQGLILKELLI
jgi:hypothetical protein